MSASGDVYVHDSATVESGATLGEGTKIWHQAQIRTGANVGARCNVGKGVFIDTGVAIGDDCKLQNYACVYRGTTLGRGVFVGPHVVFTNDVRPRAASAAFAPLGDEDWTIGRTEVGDGAAIGANATILPGLRIGRWSMIAAAAVVTHDVADYALVVGSPARPCGYVCACGERLADAAHACERCGPLPADHPLARRG